MSHPRTILEPDALAQVRLISAEDVSDLLFPKVVPSTKGGRDLTPGFMLSPGSVTGRLTTRRPKAVKSTSRDAVILAKTDPSLSDVEDLNSVDGLVLGSAGSTSHLVIMARSKGIPCIQIPQLQLRPEGVVMLETGQVLKEGSPCTIDGTRHRVSWGHDTVLQSIRKG